MKKLPVFFTSIALSGLTVFAQPSSKLAVIGIEPSASLAKKLAAPPPAKGETGPSAIGSWRGVLHNGRNGPLIVVALRKNPNGTVHGDITNLSDHHMYSSENVLISGTHIKFPYNVNGRPDVMEGDLDPASDSIEGTISMPGRSWPIKFNRVAQTDTAANPASAEPALSPLESITHAVDTHLVDRFGENHTLAIMEDADVKQAVPMTGSQYNLKNQPILDAFKKAGVGYLLVTSLEDLTEQTLDEAQGRVGYKTGAYNTQSNVETGPNVRRKKNAGAAVATQGQFAPHVKKGQILRVTVRTRVYDLSNGQLLDSASHTFATNRAYVALAAGNNMENTSDLYEAAAIDIADWTVRRAGDTVFPIKVLDKADKEVTINRGLDGNLQVGQTFMVYTLGKEIKDPTSGEVLGRDELIAGKVAISSLRDKFSKAKVLEDTGIVAGATLRSAK